MVICNHDPGDSASRGSGGHVGEETMRTKNFQLNSMACVIQLTSNWATGLRWLLI